MWRHYVYIHRKATTGEVFYVGKGTKRPRDSAECFDRAHDTTSRNKWWSNVANKHGFKVEVIAMFKSDADSQSFEKALIAEYGRSALVNMTDGGDGCAGIVMSESARRKLSEHAKKPRSDAWVKSIRKARHGGGNGGVVKHGDKLPADWKAAIAKTKVGNRNPMYGKTGIEHPLSRPVVNIQNGVFFESVAEAADALGYTMQTFHKWMTGARPNKTLWRFA